MIQSLDDKQASTTITGFKGFLKLVRQSKPRYILFGIGITFSLLSAVIQLQVPRMLQPFINDFSKEINWQELGLIVFLYIGAAIISALSSAILGVFGENVVKNLRISIWNKLIHLKIEFFSNEKTGSLSSHLISDTTQVKTLLADTAPSTLTSTLLFAGSIFLMVQMDWRLTVVMIIIVPIATLIFMSLGTIAQRIGRARQDTLADFTGTVQEILLEARLVKSSNAESQTTVDIKEKIDRLYQIGKKEALYDGSLQPIMTLLMMMTILTLLGYGIQRVLTGTMQMGTLMSFIMYLMNLVGALPSLAVVFSEVQKVSGSTQRLNELLNEEQEELDEGIIVDVGDKTLTAEKLYFSYNNQFGGEVLSNVSFEAKPNTIIAFAGPSGGGKSTIFSLLERFYEPQSGMIKIGQQNISQISLYFWRTQIGFVSQDSAIISGTIRQNLVFGLDVKFSDEQLWKVLDLAFARSFVESMPNKLDTQVGERGVKVSGGERQRIAIARVFLRNPKILMLDEATALLDSESEAMIQQALEVLMEGRTTLVIAHRLSTIVNADKIYFIENGEITGSGKHQELINTHKLYAQYVREQLDI